MFMRCIQGKIVVITGAASGIGKAMAHRFARAGARLHLIDVDELSLRAVLGELTSRGADCSHTICDLGELGEVQFAIQHTLSRRRHIDLLINNAGISYYGPTTEMTDAQCEQLLAVNFLAPIRLTRGLLPVLLSRAESHVVNVSSMYGFVVTPRSAAYHASKYGLLGFSDSLRAEFARYGLQVTTLCPGYVRTRLYETIMHPANRNIPQPPWYLTTSPEAVAGRAFRAVQRNQRLVTVTPLARIAYDLSRFFPGLFDRLYRLGRRKPFPIDPFVQAQLTGVASSQQTVARAA
jgi:short-subunit dehydrogenase